MTREIGHATTDAHAPPEIRAPAKRLPIKVFDFFTGCGGTCQGFLNAGLDVVFALDNDPAAGKTFRRNFPWIPFFQEDIYSVSCQDLKPLIDSCEEHPVLFSGCAPCQPFTKQKTKLPPSDARRLLLKEFLRFVIYYQPDFVFIENVPGLQRVGEDEGPFPDFVAALGSMKYTYRFGVIASQSYGVPQIRRRLVLIASRLGQIEFPRETHGPSVGREYSSVRDWIANLPALAAGHVDLSVPNHRAAKLSHMNIQRISALGEGGDRRQWPERLRLKCHSNGYKGHTDVYGRMRWDSPATGLTTRCVSLSNGRFGHPSQDRAISVREAACLQTFPRDFVFEGTLSAMARQIGNAVPVLLAEAFGRNFASHLPSQLSEAH